MMSGGRQLQHGRALALDQAREQHHKSVGEFQRVVMDHGIIRIDLPETREPLSDFLVPEDANAERWLAFDVVIERDLGTRQQTNSDMRLADGSEATGDGIAEFGRYQLVLDLGQAGSRHGADYSHTLTGLLVLSKLGLQGISTLACQYDPS